MSVAEKAFDIVVKNIDKIAGGAAVAAVGAGVGYAAKAVVDDRKFQQRAEAVYELGVKKGVKLGSAEARRVFVDPLLARLVVSQSIGYAWDDSNPRIQLEPIGIREYIELHPVKSI